MLKRTLLLSLLLAASGTQAQDQAAQDQAVPQDQAVQAQDQAVPQEEPPASQNQAAQVQPIVQQVAPEICMTCHGSDGNNWVQKDDGTFGKTDGGADSAKLAGQNSGYLLKQFKDFKSGARVNPVMNGMIVMLPDDTMKEVAEFYATQKVYPAAAKNTDEQSDAFKLGQKLWRGGIASKGLPACAACHGPAGKGMPAQYPALAGQFPEYIEAQLKVFRDETRTNDPSKMMRDIALKMTDKEIQAVSDYAAGLR
ncbi:MAG: c-type cytochrome [Betaproteobacteria bacterium]|nr:c-type cytochrome [Betaproteobacteria bacterium]